MGCTGDARLEPLIVSCGTLCVLLCFFVFLFFFQAEDGIRYLVRSRGLGDVYKRQAEAFIFNGHLVQLDGGPRVLAHFSHGRRQAARALSLIHI